MKIVKMDHMTKQLLVFWTSGKAGSASKSLWRMRDALERVLKLGCFKGVPGRGNWKAIVEQLLLEMKVKGGKIPLLCNLKMKTSEKLGFK